MGGVHDCFSSPVDACYAPYRVQCMDIFIVPVVMEAKSNEMIDGYLDVRMPFEFARYYGKI